VRIVYAPTTIIAIALWHYVGALWIRKDGCSFFRDALRKRFGAISTHVEVLRYRFKLR
jgi:hypothetical protein